MSAEQLSQEQEARTTAPWGREHLACCRGCGHCQWWCSRWPSWWLFASSWRTLVPIFPPIMCCCHSGFCSQASVALCCTVWFFSISMDTLEAPGTVLGCRVRVCIFPILVELLLHPALECRAHFLVCRGWSLQSCLNGPNEQCMCILLLTFYDFYEEFTLLFW